MQRISVGILASGIFLIGLTLAFLLGAGGRGHLFLPLLFTVLAFTTLIGSIRTLSPQGVYGGIQGFFLQLSLGISLSRGLLAVDSRGRRHLGDPGEAVCSHHLRIDWNGYSGSYSWSEPVVPGLNKREARRS